MRQPDAIYSYYALILFLILCLILLLRYLRTHSRRLIIHDFALKNDLDYSKRKKINKLYKHFRVSDFYLFNGKNVSVNNVMEGHLKEYSFVFFDFYLYEKHHSHRLHPYTCAMFRFYYDPLPDFILSPVSLFNIFWQAKSIKNYHSPNKKFNQKYILQYDNTDEKPFRLTRGFVEYMERYGRDIIVEKIDHHLLIYSKKINPHNTDYDHFIKQCVRIYELYP